MNLCINFLDSYMDPGSYPPEITAKHIWARGASPIYKFGLSSYVDVPRKFPFSLLRPLGGKSRSVSTLLF